MTIFHIIQTTSSNHHCSIGLNTYNNTYNQSPHCRCINNNPITCSRTKNPPKTKSSVSRLEMVVLAQDAVDERDDDVYVACSRHGHVKDTTMVAGK